MPRLCSKPDSLGMDVARNEDSDLTSNCCTKDIGNFAMVSGEDLTMFAEATAVKALSSHEYEAYFPSDWCIGAGTSRCLSFLAVLIVKVTKSLGSWHGKYSNLLSLIGTLGFQFLAISGTYVQSVNTFPER
jgi:hypothetical protein